MIFIFESEIQLKALHLAKGKKVIIDWNLKHYQTGAPDIWNVLIHV